MRYLVMVPAVVTSILSCLCWVGAVYTPGWWRVPVVVVAACLMFAGLATAALVDR